MISEHTFAAISEFASTFKGFKKATIDFTKTCKLCQGTGTYDDLQDFAFSNTETAKETQCPQCKGARGVDSILTIEVTHKPFYEFKKAK